MNDAVDQPDGDSLAPLKLPSVQRFSLVESLFHRIAALPEAERVAALHHACAGDEELGIDVRALLDCESSPLAQALDRPLAVVHDSAEATPTGASHSAPAAVPPNPDAVVISASSLPIHQVGRYRLIRLLGSGGMGEVYEAEQDSPRRRAALKILRTGDAAGLLPRFEREAEVLGRLRHPGIAHIYEAGRVGLVGTHGEPVHVIHFIAMELVEGVRLDVHASMAALDTRGRLALMARVCDAVEHAHSLGVVHRDLKPDNILVDRHGQPKVLDFGIARLVDRPHDPTLQTGAGQLLGTLAYMSPEQLAADPARIDARSDVYSLGVVLYELLSGMLPFDLRGRSMPDALRVIREQEPGTSFTRAAAAGGVTPGPFWGDVATIVGKALEREPDRRYASAADLAADIRRHLADEPIMARPQGRVYRVRKFTRRHRGLVVAATAVLAVLSTGLLVAVVLSVREAAARAGQERALYQAQLAAAEAARRDANLATMRNALSASPVHLRHWEWRHLDWMANRSDVLNGPAGVRPVHIATVQAPPALVVAESNGQLAVLAASTGETLAMYELPSGWQARSAAASADGAWLLVSMVPQDLEAQPPSGEWLADPLRAGSIRSAGFACFALRLQSGTQAQRPRTPAWTRTDCSSRLAAFCEGSDRIPAVRGSDGKLLLLGVATGDTVWEGRLPDDGIDFDTVVTALNGASLVASGPARGGEPSASSTTAVLRFQYGEAALRPIAERPGSLLGIDVHGARAWLLDGSTIHVVDPGSGNALGRLDLPQSSHGASACMIDDERIAVCIESERTATLWSLATARPTSVLDRGDEPWRLAAHPIGDRIFATSPKGRIISLRTCMLATSVREPGDDLLAAEVSAEGSDVVVATLNCVSLFDTQSGVARWSATVYTGDRAAMARSSDGSLIVLGGADGMLHLIDAMTGEVRRSRPSSHRRIACLEWIASDTLIAAVGEDGQVALVDRALSTVPVRWSRGATRDRDGWRVELAARLPSGRLALIEASTLAAARDSPNPGDRSGARRALRIIRDVSATAADVSIELPVECDRVLALVPGGGEGVLLACSATHVLRIDLARGIVDPTWHEPAVTLCCATATADGQRMLAGTSDGRILVWDSEGTLLVALGTPARDVLAIRYFEQPERVVASGSKAPVILLGVRPSESR